MLGVNKRTLLLVALLFLSVSSICAQLIGNEAPIMSYLREAMHFNRAIPQEKVYLHLDNTGYFENETVWFKAYLVRTDRSSPSDLSKVLYVELLNMSGDVIKTTKWPVDSLGQSRGDLKLDSLLGSGFYEIRAYTRYMTSWGPSRVLLTRHPSLQEALGGRQLQRPVHQAAPVQAP